jgi:RimJ/RimL family protein N-acetyltransferase
MFPEAIETKRLMLRRPKQSDIPALIGLWQNEQVRQCLGGLVSREEAEKRIAVSLQHWQEHGFGSWCVFMKETNELTGFCGLSYHDEKDVEISFQLYPAFWGQGLATEIGAASLDVGFTMLKLARITAITQEANRGMQRVLEKLGMRQTHNLWQWDTWQRYYVMTRKNWMEKQSKIFLDNRQL